MSNHQLSIDNSQVPEGYKQTEVGVIPEEWKTMVFSEIASCRKDRIDPRKSGTQEFCIELEHIESGTGRLLGNTQTGYQSSLKAVFQPGDVFFGKLRSYLRKYWLADREGVCSTEIWVLVANSSLALSEFLYQIVTTEQFIDIASTAYGTHMPRSDWNLVKNYNVAVPPVKEQCAIAQTLSDVDGLIAALDKLIAKKRNIKTATMQELLTGKKRLPGFGEGKGYKNTEVGVIPEDWEVIKLGDILKIRHGKSQHEIIDPNGIYPILATGGEIGRTNTPLYSEPSVLIGRKGTIDSPRYMDTPFWTVDTLFYSEIFNKTDAKFVFYKFYLIDWYSYNEASGVPSLNAATIEDINQAFPALKEEQCAIASILSDMDAEIAALEKRRAKTQAMKQGMMQELLTGKTRLIVSNNP